MLFPHAVESPFSFSLRYCRSGSHLAHHLLAETVDLAFAGDGDQAHDAALAGLEANRGSGRDVEPEALRLPAIELERRVGLEEMIVRADLDRPVAGIGDLDRHRFAPLVHGDVAGFGHHLARNLLVVRAPDRLVD